MDEAVEVAVQDPFGVSDFEIGPVVFDHLIRVQNVRADLAPETRVLRDAALAGELLLPPLLFKLGKA